VLLRVEARLNADAPPGLEQGATNYAGDLATAMLQCATAGLISLHSRASTLTTRISERPVASGLARFTAQRQPVVSNLRHSFVELSDLERFVLIGLDGRQTRADLVAAVQRAIADGQLASSRQQIADQDLGAAIDACLAKFATVALLEQ
jgi:methyltransferase-like protein